jgi:hypothetical protein
MPGFQVLRAYQFLAGEVGIVLIATVQPICQVGQRNGKDGTDDGKAAGVTHAPHGFRYDLEHGSLAKGCDGAVCSGCAMHSAG